MALVFEKGRVIGQRYRLARLIGEGGMGSVWAATHEVTRRAVALKVLRGNDAARPEVRRRFLREARAASAVKHPNVVEVFDIFELPDGAPVMVMDLLEGESLRQRLRRLGKPSVTELAEILIPVVSAVGTAHAAGIVHRDLKPDNIFLARGSDGAVSVKVLDFGIAKLTALEGDLAHTGGLTQTGEMLGTPHYMAPEQVAGESDVDHRIDVWAIGVILYECLSGQQPFPGQNVGQVLKRILTGALQPLAEVAPGVAPELAELVGRMLSQDRGARPADLREVRSVLERFASVPAPSFSAARTPSSEEIARARSEISAPIAKLTGSDPFGDTADQGASASPSPSGEPAPAPGRRRWPLWLGGAAAAVAAGAVGLVLASSTPSPSASVTPPSAAVVAPPSAAVVTPVVAPMPSPAPATLAAEPRPAPSFPTVRRPSDRAPAHHASHAVAPTSPTLMEKPPAAAPPKPAQRLPGGIPADAPY